MVFWEVFIDLEMFHRFLPKCLTDFSVSFLFSSKCMKESRLFRWSSFLFVSKGFCSGLDVVPVPSGFLVVV